MLSGTEDPAAKGRGPVGRGGTEAKGRLCGGAIGPVDGPPSGDTTGDDPTDGGCPGIARDDSFVDGSAGVKGSADAAPPKFGSCGAAFLRLPATSGVDEEVELVLMTLSILVDPSVEAAGAADVDSMPSGKDV